MPDVSKPPRLQRRGSAYFLRAKVPADLRSVIGKREITKTLGTTNYRTACQRLTVASAEVDALFAEARRKALAPVAEAVEPSTDAEISRAVRLWLQKEETDALSERGPADDYEREQYAESLDFEEWEFAHPDAVENPSVYGVARSIVAKHALRVVQPSREFRLLLRLTARAILEHVRRDRERLTQLVVDKHFDPIFAAHPVELASSSAAAAPARPISFAKLVENWAADRKVGEKSAYTMRVRTRLFRAFLGHNDATRIVGDDLKKWRSALVEQGLTPRTAQNYLNDAKTLLRWAHDAGHLKVNPGEGLRSVVSKRAKPHERRLPFSDQEASLLLRHARAQRGADRWVPWLLAFSGARVEEICQMLVKDVREEAGILILDLNDDDAGKSLKNAGSRRKVPLHSALVQEGFLAYVDGLKPDGPLFPDLKPGPFGGRSAAYSKRSGRLIRSLGIRDRRKVPNHSWRHPFKDRCRDAGVPADVHDALTGHAPTNEGGRYGSGHSLGTLAAAIQRIPISRRPHTQCGRSCNWLHRSRRPGG